LSQELALQALDERRLVLRLNADGKVTHVLSTRTPITLYGFDPDSLIGLSAAVFITSLQQRRGEVEGTAAMQ
jgi:hypothetical protein